MPVKKKTTTSTRRKTTPKKKSGPKKPWKRTDKVVKQLEYLIETGCTAKYAYASAGISKQTYYTRLKDEDFLTLIEEAKGRWLAKVHNKKSSLINDKHFGAIQMELKAKERELYGDKKDINLNGTMQTTELTPEQMEAIQTALKANGYE